MHEENLPGKGFSEAERKASLRVDLLLCWIEAINENPRLDSRTKKKVTSFLKKMASYIVSEWNVPEEENNQG